MSTNPEYIYSEESENFSFFRIPCALGERTSVSETFPPIPSCCTALWIA